MDQPYLVLLKTPEDEESKPSEPARDD